MSQLEGFVHKLFHAPSIGTDVFGYPKAGQVAIPDRLNRNLFISHYREYIQWHEENHRFYDSYKNDKRAEKLHYFSQYIFGLVGFSFAGMVLNPNYTQPKSFYLRKINVALFTLIGYMAGYRNLQNQKSLTNMRMFDYFPLEIKRALESQDYRHIALFNYKDPERKLFDDETGKSLS